ncbi:choice-of-anchor D domain-containing protein [Myxococcota bacterium]|nr:choice-of-anchor D domain-containing protein [Myxococcota bacterium]
MALSPPFSAPWAPLPRIAPALLLGAGLGCSDYKVTAQEPELVLSADTLDFDEVVRGTQLTLTFFAKNEGRAPLKLERVALTDGSSAEFTVMSGDGIGVEANDEGEISIRYAPAEVGQDLGELEITSNDPKRPLATVSLVGYGVEPRIDVDPEQLWFGTVPVGDTVTLTVDVAARGQGRLRVDELSLGDGLDAVYTVTLPEHVTLPYKLSPGEAFSFDVSFTPTSEAPWTGELLVRSNDPNDPVVPVTLYGNMTGSGDEPPRVEITTPDWGNYLIEGAETTLKGVVSDDADSPEDLLCAWYANGKLIGSSVADATGALSLATEKLPAGEVTVTLRAVDGQGHSSDDSVDVVVWPEDEPLKYTLSGGESIFDYWSVDDDVSIYVDGELVFQDTNRTQDHHAPVEFEAKVGSTVRLVANDVNSCALYMDALVLHFGTSAHQALNDTICRSACAADACYDGTYGGPWPSVFLDESYVISIP